MVAGGKKGKIFLHYKFQKFLQKTYSLGVKINLKRGEGNLSKCTIYIHVYDRKNF